MIDNIINDVKEVLTVVETICSEKLKKDSDRLKFADLLKEVGSRLNISNVNIENVDPVIRFYIKSYSNYEIVRGMGGGIRIKQTKNSKTSVETSKEEARAIVEAKLANKISEVPETIEEVEKSIDDSEDGF